MPPHHGFLRKLYLPPVRVATIDDQVFRRDSFHADDLDRHLALLLQPGQLQPLAIVQIIGHVLGGRDGDPEIGERWLARISSRTTSIAMLSAVFTTPDPLQLGHSM